MLAPVTLKLMTQKRLLQRPMNCWSRKLPDSRAYLDAFPEVRRAYCHCKSPGLVNWTLCFLTSLLLPLDPEMEVLEIMKELAHTGMTNGSGNSRNGICRK